MAWLCGTLEAHCCVVFDAPTAWSSLRINAHRSDSNSPSAACLNPLQACAEGSLLNIQLPGGSPHVVLISLLHMLHELRYHFAAMGGAPCVGKVLLRLGLQVRAGGGLRCKPAVLPASICIDTMDRVPATSAVHVRCSLMVCRAVLPITRVRWTDGLLALLLLAPPLPPPPAQGQDAKALSHVVTSQLCTLASPFVALPAPALCNQPGMPAQVEELQFAADSLAVAEWLHGSAVAVALGVLSQSGPGIMPGMAGGMMGSRGVDGMMAAQEDAQRELKCRQAMMSVQAFERTCGINAQVRRLWLPQACAELFLVAAIDTLC